MRSFGGPQSRDLLGAEPKPPNASSSTSTVTPPKNTKTSLTNQAASVRISSDAISGPHISNPRPLPEFVSSETNSAHLPSMAGSFPRPSSGNGNRPADLPPIGPAAPPVDYGDHLRNVTSKQPHKSPAFFKSSDISMGFGDFLDLANLPEKVQTMTSVASLIGELKYEIDAESTNVVLSLLSLFYRLYNMDTLTDLFVTSVEFLKSVFGISAVIQSAKDIYSFLCRHLSGLYNKLLLASTVKTESMVLDALRNMRSNLNVVLNSDIVTAIRDFVLSLVSFKVFTKETASKITSFAGPAKATTVSELAIVCLDSLISTLNFSHQLYQGDSLTDIFCSKDPISSFIAEADELESISELTYSGLPVDGRICRREYYSKVISVIGDGEKLELMTPTNAPQRKAIINSIRRLKATKARFNLAMCAETRPAPKAVLIEGMPGVGKSVILDMVAMVWANVKGRTFDPSHVYHRQLEPYWSGYEPLSQSTIHLSEPGALHRSIAKSSGDPRMDEFLSLVDNQPYMCAMADLESKGKVYALPELLIMDANDPTLNLDVIYNNPAAVRRRILYIKPTVKAEFLKQGTCRIDQVKSLASETPRLDRWLFSVYTMDPVDNKKSSQVNHLSMVDVYELTRWLEKDFTAHVREQELRVNLTSGVDINDYLGRGDKTEDLPPNPDVDAQLDDAFSSSSSDSGACGASGPQEGGAHSQCSTCSYESSREDDFLYSDSDSRDSVSEELHSNIAEIDGLLSRAKNIKSESSFVAPELNLDDPKVQALLRRAADVSQANAEETARVEAALEAEKDYQTLKARKEALDRTHEEADELLRAADLRREQLLKQQSYREHHYALFKEISWYFIKVLFDISALAFYGLSFLILWFWPQHLALKLSSLGVCKVKVEYHKDKFMHSWNLFKGSLGLKNDYKGRPVPSYELVRYITAFTVALVVIKSMSAATLWSEGALVSSSRSRTDDEIDEEIATTEKQIKSKMPLPRACVGRTQNWDTTVPTVVSVTSDKARNESSKVQSTIRRNVRELIISGEICIRTRVLGLKKDYALINRHSLAKPKSGQWDLTVAKDRTHTSGVSRVTIDDSQMVRLSADLYLVRLRGSKFADITEYLPNDYVVPRDFGTAGSIDGVPTTIVSISSVTAKSEYYGEVVIERPLTYPWSDHVVGACGTPLLMEAGGVTVVAGIHSAGDDNGEAYAESISLPTIQAALVKLKKSSGLLEIHSQGRLNLPTGLDLGPITPRSPLRFEESPSICPVGGMVGYNVMKPGKSAIRSTQFVHHAQSLVGTSPFQDGHPKFGPPRMGPGRNPDTGEYQAAPNHFVKKAGVVKKSLSPTTMKTVVKVVTDHIVSALKERGVTSLSPVPLSVAQNGHPQDFYLRAMKPSTSAGFTFPGAKKKYSTPVSLDFKEEAYHPSGDVLEQVVEAYDSYSRHEDSHPIMGAQLKDEPRAYEKVRTAKTRVFCMSSYNSTLVNRMLLMPFYSLMVEHSDVFGAAIGINMHGLDVDDFASKMRDFSDQYMEGDYSGFDTSMPLDVGLMANSVVYNVLESFGYSPEALQAVTGVLSDNLYPLIALLGDLFTVPALQPSGKYATAEDNSLRGLILMVYAWVDMCSTDSSPSPYTGETTSQYKPEDFWTYVLPRIYGDDLLAAVKHDVSRYYNNNTYQLFCKEVYGIGYTNAQKTDVMQPFLEWHETSFLKRGFVFRDDLGHWVAPLDLDSIMKSICYRLPSKTVSEDEQMIDSCTSALRELFFHLPRDEYDARRLEFAKVCSEIYNKDPQRVLSVFPTFLQIKEQLYSPTEEE